MPAKSLRVNLTPKDEFESSLIGRILKWSLTAGKSIVVLTEFVVILAFLSRFKLDMDLNDLNASILQKSAIVESYSEVESQMRDLLAHAAVIKEANDKTIDVKIFMDSFSTKIPREVKFDSIQVANGLLNLKGGSSTEAGLAALLNALKKDPQYNSIGVGEIQFNQRKGLIEFTINAKNVAPVAGIRRPAPTPTP